VRGLKVKVDGRRGRGLKVKGREGRGEMSAPLEK